MLRSIAAAALLLVLAPPVLAAAPPPGGQFAKTDCDAPPFKAFMLSQLGHGKNMVSGRQMPTRFDYGPIVSAQTISNTGTAIVCEIQVDFSPGQTGTHLIHGRFTAMRKPNGQNGWTWQPGS